MDSQKSKSKNVIPKKGNVLEDDEDNDDMEMGETEKYIDNNGEEEEKLNETISLTTGKFI